MIEVATSGIPTKAVIVQKQTNKGKYAENLARTTRFSSLVAGEEVPKVVVLPEGALTGYFLEGAVYDSRFPPSGSQKISRERGAAQPAIAVLSCVAVFRERSRHVQQRDLFARRQRSTRNRPRAPQDVPSTYGVFDEERFSPRSTLGVFDYMPWQAAMMVCEDVAFDHADDAAVKGARIFLCHRLHPGEYRRRR